MVVIVFSSFSTGIESVVTAKVKCVVSGSLKLDKSKIRLDIFNCCGMISIERSGCLFDATDNQFYFLSL